MQDITLTLTMQEVSGIVEVLNNLPTKSGAYPLVIKITEQVNEQVPKAEVE